jgi:hypothetical protein
MVDTPNRDAAAAAAEHQRGRPAEPGTGGLGSQQQDESGLGGQEPGSKVRRTGQADDNQDDLGRDVNDKRRASTNNPGKR